MFTPLWGPCSPSWFCQHPGPGRWHLGRWNHTNHRWRSLFSQRGVKLAGTACSSPQALPRNPKRAPPSGLVVQCMSGLLPPPPHPTDYWVHTDGATSCPDRPCLRREGPAAPGQSLLLVWGWGECKGEVGSRTAFGMSGKIWKIDLTIVCVRACMRRNRKSCWHQNFSFSCVCETLRTFSSSSVSSQPSAFKIHF